MLITPRPGADRNSIRQVLGGAHTMAVNLGTSSNAFERLLTYLQWATDSARMLRSQISDRDLNQLVFTDRYRALLGSCGTLAGTAQQGLVNGLVELEVAERIEALAAAVKALDTQIGGWSQRVVFVVADSSFYIQNEVKLTDVDLHKVLDVPRREFVRLTTRRYGSPRKQHGSWNTSWTIACRRSTNWPRTPGCVEPSYVGSDGRTSIRTTPGSPCGRRSFP